MRLPGRAGALALLSMTAGATVLGFSLGGMTGVDRRLQAATTTTTTTPVVVTQPAAVRVALDDGRDDGHDQVRGHGRGLPAGDRGRREL